MRVELLTQPDAFYNVDVATIEGGLIMKWLLMIAATIAIGFTVYSLLSKASETGASIQKAPITTIIVRLQKKEPIAGDDLYKVINDKHQIAKIVEFTDDQLSKTDWQSDLALNWFLNLEFYEGNTHKRDFGFGGGFFSTADHGYRIRTITKEERQTFLKLISITEEEYSEIWRKSFETGPWKQKP